MIGQFFGFMARLVTSASGHAFLFTYTGRYLQTQSVRPTLLEGGLPVALHSHEWKSFSLAGFRWPFLYTEVVSEGRRLFISVPPSWYALGNILRAPPSSIWASMSTHSATLHLYCDPRDLSCVDLCNPRRRNSIAQALS